MLLNVQVISKLRSTLCDRIRQVLVEWSLCRIHDDVSSPDVPPTDFARIRTDPYKLLGHEGTVLSVAFDPDTNNLVSCSYDHVIATWDMNSRAMEWVQRHVHNSPVNTVAVTSRDSCILWGDADGRVFRWNRRDENPTEVHYSKRGNVLCLAISPDNKLVAIARADQKITLLRIPTSEKLFTRTAHISQVSCVSFGCDNKLFATCSHDFTAKVWDAETGKVVRHLKHSSGVALWSVAMMSDGKQVVSGSRAGSIIIWTLSDKKPKEFHNAHNYGVRCLAAFPEDMRIASGGGDDLVKVWDVSTMTQILTLKRHEGLVQSVALLGHGSQLASADEGGTIIIWNLEESSDEIVPPGETLAPARKRMSDQHEARRRIAELVAAF